MLTHTLPLSHCLTTSYMAHLVTSTPCTHRHSLHSFCTRSPLLGSNLLRRLSSNLTLSWEVAGCNTFTYDEHRGCNCEAKRCHRPSPCSTPYRTHNQSHCPNLNNHHCSTSRFFARTKTHTHTHTHRIYLRKHIIISTWEPSRSHVPYLGPPMSRHRKSLWRHSPLCP